MFNNKTGGKLLDEGGYGCVYHPSINCDGNESNNMKYKLIPSYPPIIRDISLSFDKSIKNSEIINIIKSNGGKYLSNILLFDYYYKNDKSANKKSLAYSLHFYSNKRTLIDDEINPSIQESSFY